MEQGANKLQEIYKNDVGVDFSSEVLSFRREFKGERKSLKTVMDCYQLLIDSHMTASVPELTTICALFLTLPVTVATAERSFSKLKLIKTYLRSDLMDYHFWLLSVMLLKS